MPLVRIGSSPSFWRKNEWLANGLRFSLSTGRCVIRTSAPDEKGQAGNDTHPNHTRDGSET